MTRDQDLPTGPDLPPPVRAWLSLDDTWADPPPGLPEEILAAMRRERGEAQPEPPPAGRLRPRRNPLWLAVAAAVVVILAIGAGVTWLRSSPADATATLTATALAPGASGRAEFHDTPSGFKIELDTRGLPPAAPGTYYQAWLKNAAGQLVTIGTFHARDGGEDIILWSAVDPSDYPTMTVTVQQEGAGAQSSGKVVLSGKVRQ